MNQFKIFALLVLSLGVSSTQTFANEVRDDYYAAHMPKSILVLPPINNTPEVNATNGYWPTATRPLAEAGYYVFPIAVVDRILKENGVSNGFEAQSISGQKLNEIFGADAALYIKLKEYGSKYQVVVTTSMVEVEAKLVDLKTGTLLWQGQHRMQQSKDYSQAGIAGLLVGAIIDQISNQVSDHAHDLSYAVSNQLYMPNLKAQKGLLWGHRSPHFVQNATSPQP